METRIFYTTYHYNMILFSEGICGLKSLATELSFAAMFAPSLVMTKSSNVDWNILESSPFDVSYSSPSLEMPTFSGVAVNSRKSFTFITPICEQVVVGIII